MKRQCAWCGEFVSAPEPKEGFYLCPMCDTEELGENRRIVLRKLRGGAEDGIHNGGVRGDAPGGRGD